jgi:hypothetical protein
LSTMIAPAGDHISRSRRLHRRSGARQTPLPGAERPFGVAGAHPLAASVGLTLVYLAALAGLVTVLLSNATGTLLGEAVLGVYGILVLTVCAIGVLIVAPERPR